MKCSIPKGTRDFLPIEMERRNYIFQTIRNVFKAYAFEQIETPSMENLDTLMGKYGEEGDKLLFKILNSGDFLKDKELNEDYRIASKQICEKGLRYDLTVPFARYVVQHRDELVLPFRRYQIQPVWRADKPQKGRYREFFQCDADMIGSTSLTNELELVQIIDSVFTHFGISVTLKINNRKILAGIAETIGAHDKLTDITTAIDKLDKIGIEKVRGELAERGLSLQQIEQLNPIFELNGSTDEKLKKLHIILGNSEIGTRGVTETEKLFELINISKPSCNIELDLTLARGLNYYTGAIFEVKANNVSIGSICGGGRYDNLTGIFGLPNVSGVGISFGADRIYDVLTELNKFPKGIGVIAKALFINFGETEQAYCIGCAIKLRSAGISTLIYPEAAKMKKQMEYANRKNIPYVLFAGESEIASNNITIKDMRSGEQKTVSQDDAIKILDKQ